MPRLRTVVITAVVVAVVTDVTSDGETLRISFGWPGGTPVASLVFP